MSYREPAFIAALGLVAGCWANQADAQQIIVTNARAPLVAPYPDVTQNVARAIDSEVQTAVEDARLRAFEMVHGGQTTGGTPLGFAPESNLDAAFAAFGYAPTDKNSMLVKAPAAPTSSGISVSFFANGTYDYEHQTGFFQGTNLANDMRSWGGTGGVDYTITLSPTSVFVFGFLGGETDAHISTPFGVSTSIRAPSASAYAALVNGNFSSDLAYTTSWYNSDGTALVPGVPLSTATMSEIISGNAHYNFNLDNSWWLQPTAGFTWTRMAEGFGLADIEIVRFQAGASVGTSFTQGGVTIQPTFTAAAYSDVSYTGGNAVGAPPIPSDQGQLWGKVDAKVNVVWSKNFSSFVEAEVHDTRGLENIFGYVATVGLRYTW